MENRTEIEVKPMTLPEVGGEIDALEIIERRAAAFERMLAVSITATNPNDWKDMGGKPYLEASGCEKAARRFGVTILDVHHEREDLADDNGRYYMYTTMGKAMLGRGFESVEAIGTCTSRDKFFAQKDGKMKPIQDVDIANIKKKSYTNFYGNAVRKLLGLNNLTWEMLEKYNIRKNGKGAVGNVSYDGGASKQEGTKTAQRAESHAKKPFWTSDFKDKTYINAKVGDHFTDSFLAGIGMRASQKTAGMYSAVFNQAIMDALELEFDAATSQSEGGAQ